MASPLCSSYALDEMHLLTVKPVLYCCNVGEDDLLDGNERCAPLNDVVAGLLKKTLLRALMLAGWCGGTGCTTFFGRGRHRGPGW